jgi:copper chaperone CopZ
MNTGFASRSALDLSWPGMLGSHMDHDLLVVTHGFPLNGADSVRLEAALSGVTGVKQVSMAGATVRVTYDLAQADLDIILDQIAKAGGAASCGLFERIRLGWLRFSEKNRRDNILAPVRDCCNKPPGGA